PPWLRSSTKSAPPRSCVAPPSVNVFVPQLTTTVVTGPAPTRPLAPAATHVCLGVDGDDATVTKNAAPLATGVGNANTPLAATGSASPPLSRSTRPGPASPTTTPPIVYRSVVQVTSTSVTGPSAIVPAPWSTTHVCDGDVGCASTVTA